MAIQLGSVLLDACVLAVVMREDTYGYKLTQEVKQIMDVSESTLYPVLRRLQKDGYLRTYDKTSGSQPALLHGDRKGKGAVSAVLRPVEADAGQD